MPRKRLSEAEKKAVQAKSRGKANAGQRALRLAIIRELMHQKLVGDGAGREFLHLVNQLAIYYFGVDHHEEEHDLKVKEKFWEAEALGYPEALVQQIEGMMAAL